MMQLKLSNTNKRLSAFLATLLLLGAMAMTGCSDDKTSLAQKLEKPKIPYEEFVLSNGLHVIVHTNRKVPIVAVNVWYHVGSKDEIIGKTGFAHLFEHLMFNGTENYPGDFFEPFQKIGATGQNGTTNSDRTNYFENVPTHALDVALWMESDRMGHFLGALTQEVLDEQRGVVQNEKRQGENQPYGKVFAKVATATFPVGHPYSWSVIGSMQDLENASLEDAKKWFKQYYGPNNAVLVLAGDIDVETAKRKVTHYFGDIPPGPENIRVGTWVAKRTESQWDTMYDQVPQTRIYKSWNVTELGTEEHPYFELLASLLSDGENSILNRRLVRETEMATSVFAFYYDREIAGQFWIGADVKEGQDPKKVEAIIDEELQKLIAGELDADLLETTRVQFISRLIRGLERIGGFGGKSDILAQGQIYLQDPEAIYNLMFNTVRSATAEQIIKVAKKWLSSGDYTLSVYPENENLVAGDEHADRSALPIPGTPPKLVLPKIQRSSLSNGMQVIVMERHEIPVVNVRLQFNSGYHTDSNEKSGLANFAMAALIKGGTKKYSTLELDNQIKRLGASIDSGASLDACYVYLSSLKATISQSMGLFAEIARNPAFNKDEVELLRSKFIAGIKQEEAQPVSMALRVLPPLLYGTDHPYGKPLTGSGYTDSVATISPDDMHNYHKQLMQPERATLIFTGDITLKNATDMAEKFFGTWKSDKKPEPHVVSATVKQKTVNKVYLIDKPGSIQTVIIAGQLLPPISDANDINIKMATDIIGGSFTSRLNMNLREDKHWSYGARNRISGSRGPQLFYVYAPVQSDKTIESIAEIQYEFAEFLGDNPATQEELSTFIEKRVLETPGRYETLAALNNGVASIVIFNRPDDYLQTLPDKIQNIRLADVQTSIKQNLQPNNWVWVIVGDRAQLEQPLRELGIGEVILKEAK